MRAILLALALLAAPIAGCASSEDPASSSSEKPAPEWSFTDTDGQQHSRESSAGSPTVVFYMATWCSSCQKKTSDMKRVHEDYGDRIDMFSVTVDPNEGPSDLERWKQDYDQNWPHGVDENSQLQRAYGVDSQSNVVVLDSEGRLVEHWGYGAATYEEVSNVLDGLEA